MAAASTSTVGRICRSCGAAFASHTRARLHAAKSTRCQPRAAITRTLAAHRHALRTWVVQTETRAQQLRLVLATRHAGRRYDSSSTTATLLPTKLAMLPDELFALVVAFLVGSSYGPVPKPRNDMLRRYHVLNSSEVSP